MDDAIAAVAVDDRLHGRSDDTDELFDGDDLLVEEISIDGMCGVY